MLLIDAILRFSALTLLLFTGIIALRDARALLQARLTAAMCVSLAAMLVTTLPSIYQMPNWLNTISWFLHIPNTVLLWLFALSLFQDDFRLNKIHWGVLVGVYGAMFVIQYAMRSDWPMALYFSMLCNRVIGFGILLHLMWMALRGREDDLIEARRRLRLWFTLGLACTALLIISAETLQFVITLEPEDPDGLSTLRVVVAWPMIVLGASWFLRTRPENFRFDSVEPAQPRVPRIDPKDKSSHDKLTAAMQDQAYLEQGLTITALSDQIDVPEHQLRGLINKGLGYRNFAAFLNSYRIDHAKRMLADPEQARLPVLTIAMDAGFNSLAPFNRAFRDLEGTTPTAYRTERLGEMADETLSSDVEKV